MVSATAFSPVSSHLTEKSNKLRVFACTFSKIMPSEAKRRLFEFEKVRANVYTTTN